MSEIPAIEVQYVRDFYTTVQDEFASTRHTPWPQVVEWLNGLPFGSHVGDIGCGNGRHMIGTHKYEGCDTCPKFVQLTKERGYPCRFGDVTKIPFPDSHFEHTMCVAVLHHLSTQERRAIAIKELIRVTKPGGQILIAVWAYKQDAKSRRVITDQDSIILWKHSVPRYCFMFTAEDLVTLLPLHEVTIVSMVYSASNWYAILKKND